MFLELICVQFRKIIIEDDVVVLRRLSQPPHCTLCNA